MISKSAIIITTTTTSHCIDTKVHTNTTTIMHKDVEKILRYIDKSIRKGKNIKERKCAL